MASAMSLLQMTVCICLINRSSEQFVVGIEDDNTSSIWAKWEVIAVLPQLPAIPRRLGGRTRVRVCVGIEKIIEEKQSDSLTIFVDDLLFD